MKRLGFLVALLAAQLVVIALVWSLSLWPAGEISSESFLAFDASDVTQIEIRGDSDDQVQLSKQEGDWKLEQGLPADASRVNQMLEKLSMSGGGWPVATSASTAERFEVTKDKFQRHVVFRDEKQVAVADIYLGTSPGYRKTHARRSDGGPVYSIEFSNYEASAESSYWLDKQLLQPSGEVVSIEREGGYQLTKGEEGWTSKPEADLDDSLVEAHINRFENLSIFDVYEDPLPETSLHRFVIKDGKGSYVLALYSVGEEDDDDFAITSSRVENAAFEVGSYVADQINKSLDDLTVKKIVLAEQPEKVDDEEKPDTDATKAEGLDETEASPSTDTDSLESVEPAASIDQEEDVADGVSD